MFQWIRNAFYIIPRPKKATKERKQRLEDSYNEVSAHTPDIMNLEQFGLHLVFIPDYMSQLRSLQLYDQNIYYKDEKIEFHQGEAFTKDEYTFYKCKYGDDEKALGLASYGIPIETVFSTVPTARIKGDLFVTTAHGMKALDKYFRNGVQYKRKRVEVIYPYRNVERLLDTSGETLGKAGKSVKQNGPPRFLIFTVHMYVGIENYWLDLIDGGFKYTPVTTFEPRKPYHGGLDGKWISQGPYYYFSKRELED